jgi:hypothetical protein
MKRSELSSWGIYREIEHSPGREVDDALILRRSAEKLEAEGVAVRLMTADDLPEPEGELPPFLFHMCESLSTLDRLRRYEERGVIEVNAASSVVNAHRDRSIPLLERGGVTFPASRSVETSGDPDLLFREGFEPCWVKQADVHKTREGDVVMARTRAEAAGALSRMSARGIRRAVLQRHVEGDLLKFYGVGRSGGSAGSQPWFEWFYHRDQRVSGHGFSVETLSALASRAAAAVGLEVYGGDAIVDERGEIFLIDLNAWPSFALYREEASSRIASHLAARFRKEAECPQP